MAQESWGEVPEPENRKKNPTFGAPVVGEMHVTWDPSLDESADDELLSKTIVAGKTISIDLPPGSISGDSMGTLTGGRRMGKSVLSASRMTPRVFIDGEELYGVETIEMSQHEDPFGAQIRISRVPLARRDRIPDVTKQSDPERVIEALTPAFAIGEAIKKELAERGWTYEAAEEIAKNYVDLIIEKGLE